MYSIPTCTPVGRSGKVSIAGKLSKPVDVAKHSAVSIPQRDVLGDHGTECVQPITAPGVVEMNGAVGVGLHVACHRVIQHVRADKVPAHDQRGRDHVDQALGNPENDEDFEEKAAHRLVRSYRVIEFNGKLIAGATNSFHLVLRGATFGELPAQAAYVHIKAAVEGMELSAKHFL